MQSANNADVVKQRVGSGKGSQNPSVCVIRLGAVKKHMISACLVGWIIITGKAAASLQVNSSTELVASHAGGSVLVVYILAVH